MKISRPPDSRYRADTLFRISATQRFLFSLMIMAPVTPVIYLFITFRVSRRRREMYCGHGRLCVCLSVRGRMPTLARTRL